MLFDDFLSPIADESKALHDDISDALNETNVQYAKIFSRVLRGYEGAEDLKTHNDPMVVVILDAATTGRLGVTFYCELQKDEYIKRILQWHVDAAWPLTFFKKSIVEGAERVNVVQYEGAPSFTDIINCACGTSDRSSAHGAELKRETFINCACGTSDRSSKSYKRFAKDVKERLIECMFGGAQFPMSILNAACHKVTKPMGYDNIRVWRRDFEIACSLWKKHYIDETRKQHRQEDVITMYLEPNRDDRDYLYGRLLALADNFEESVLRKQGVKDRPTNAIKLMSNFTAKPYTTWGTLWKQLTPYLKSANGGSWFRNEVDDVMALFKEGDFEDNKALSPMFLLGYFAFKKAKDTDEVSIGVRGPVSIQPAFSINPIAIDDVQITKSVNSETTDSGKKSSDTMGMKYRVSGRAVYVTYGSISPQLAERTGFSAEDAEKIKEALVTLFENDESSARPSGSMEVLDVVWFAHNCKGGQYSSAKVHRSVSVDADGTVNVDDASIPGLRYEVIEGR